MTATRLPLRWLLTLFGAVVVLFHLLAMIFPSGVNWGFHHLAFLPETVSVAILFLMIAVLIPGLQERMFVFVEKATAGRKVLVWTLTIAASGLLFWLARQSTFFLGDGYLVIRNLERVRSAADIPAPFPTAPLSAFLAWHIREALRYFSVHSATQLAWQIQSIACGLMAIPLAFKLAASLTRDQLSTWIVALFLLAGGALQLFSGYVETYPPAYVVTILFLWLSLRYLAGSVPLFVPFLSFGVLFTFHFGMLSLFPALCLLIVVASRRRALASVGSALATMIVFVVLVLWMCGYTLQYFFEVVGKGGSYFLPLVVHDNWQAAYSLFSFRHLADLFNAYMLLSPFLFILVPFALVVLWQKEMRRKPETIFLGLALLGAAVWTLVTNFEVGMSRDWDVMAPLSLCVSAFALFALGQMRDDTRHGLVLGMALVTLLHTAAWISVNAGEDSSISRFVLLQDSRVRSQRAIAYACEDLAGFYRDRKQYAEALPFLEETVAIDSTNARRWLSLANVYQLAEQDENAMHSYEESARYGIRDKAAFFNLGVLYYNHGRREEAIASLNRAAAIDPADTLVSSTLKFMMSKKSRDGGH